MHATHPSLFNPTDAFTQYPPGTNVPTLHEDTSKPDWVISAAVSSSAGQAVVFADDPEGKDRCLLIDGTIQICDSYEAEYTEGFTQIAASFLPELKRALIIGGGDALALNELLRYPSIEKIYQLELDPTVPRLSELMFGVRSHMPAKLRTPPPTDTKIADDDDEARYTQNFYNLTRGIWPNSLRMGPRPLPTPEQLQNPDFQKLFAQRLLHNADYAIDPRVEWVFGDAAVTLAALENAVLGEGKLFDMIVIDVSETGKSDTVVTTSFFKRLKKMLKPEGIMIKNEHYQEEMRKLFKHMLEVRCVFFC